MPWGMWIVWTSQVSCGPHRYHVDLISIMWPHQRGVIKGPPPARHRALPWAPSTAGCPHSWVAGAARSTLPAQAIPPRSRTWHGGRYHLQSDMDDRSWGSLTHLSGLDPFVRSTELLSSAGCWEQ